jgi:hypothetical protein
MGDWKITAFKMESSGMLELLNEDFVGDELEDRAGRGRDAAQAGNPKYTYVIERIKTDRQACRYGSEDPGILFSESNTGNLIRSLDACAGSS